MTIVDPFSSEKVVNGRIVLEPVEIIASTLLDDSPTEVDSGEIVVPDGDAELVVLCSCEVTLGSPTSLTWQFLISFDGTNFFALDEETGEWDDITITAANMPDARAVAKGRVVAPYFKVKAVGAGTTGSDTITVSASITRKPLTIQV